MSDMMPTSVPVSPTAALIGTSSANPPEGLPNREQVVVQHALDLFHRAPDWVTFYREVLGVDGLVRKLFPRAEELFVFEQSPECAQIQQMLARLREKKEEPSQELEPTRVITVRLPKSVHESLKVEAHDRRTSMNKLCISKLLQIVDAELTPAGE